MLLHKYNRQTYENIVRMFRETDRVAAVQPTGTGKSFLMLQLISDNPDKKFLIVSPSIYIFSQLRIHAKNNNVRIDNCDYATYTKLTAITSEEIAEFNCDYIFLDEFHRCGASEWGVGVQNLLDAYPKSKVFGTSATPIRYLDSARNMAEELFNNNYAVNMSLAEAIRKKILPLPVYITAMYSFVGEVAKLEKRAEQSKNQYFKTLLNTKIQKAKAMITDLNCGLDTIFSKHMTDRSGKYIVFCANKERLHQAYGEAEKWFGKVSDNVHKYAVYSQYVASEKQFADFRDDSDDSALKVLFCVDMLNEGVHVDNIAGVIMIRATKSANIFYQQLGRALSCSSGNRPVIFDIVNNFETGDTANQYAEIMELGRHKNAPDEYDLQFELHDYVRDIRDILDELRFTFEHSWEVVYGVLKEFVEVKGQLPAYDEVYHGYKLGKWCSNQRSMRNTGNLTDERIRLLDELDFIWDANDVRWMSSFYNVKSYYEKHGRLPKSRENDEEANTIYSWIRNQKEHNKVEPLSEKRKQLLESIGINLEITPQKSWEEKFSVLSAYVKKHKTFPSVSEAKESEETGVIYRWMLRQRKAYNEGSLITARIEKLESIGFVWDSDESQWNKQFTYLKIFVQQNNCPPMPKDKVRNVCIGVWYKKQKSDYKAGKLTDEQREKLESLGVFEMEQNDLFGRTAWIKHYELLKKFLKIFGRLPYVNEKYEEIDLYSWIYAMKRKFQDGTLNKLYAEGFAELNIDLASPNVCPEMPRPAWMQIYEDYEIFLSEYHRRPLLTDGPLYQWENEMQRKYKLGDLKPVQVNMLRQVGIIE